MIISLLPRRNPPSGDWRAAVSRFQEETGGMEAQEGSQTATADTSEAGPERWLSKAMGYNDKGISVDKKLK